MIKTFRGLIKDGGEETIRLKTNDGSTGYRIVKFQLFPNHPGTQSAESTVSIFKVSGRGSGTVTAVVDFSDNTLLAAAYYQDDHQTAYTASEAVVFDRELFNQDIFVTMTDTVGAEPINYYIELEQVMLNENETTMATLQSLRQVAER